MSAAPCTRDTPRCDVARSYQYPLPACCRGHLRQMMTDFQSSCARHRVRWWADYGTLLGAVRNSRTTAADYPWLPVDQLPEGPLPAGIVPHDKDGDLGVLMSQWRELLHVRRDLLAKGYHVKVRLHSASLKILLSECNHTNIDVFTWQPGPGDTLRRRSYISADNFKGRAFPAAWLNPMSTVMWEGLEIPAPADPEAFCAFRYGEGWATPLPANHDGVRRG